MENEKTRPPDLTTDGRATDTDTDHSLPISYRIFARQVEPRRTASCQSPMSTVTHIPGARAARTPRTTHTTRTATAEQLAARGGWFYVGADEGYWCATAAALWRWREGDGVFVRVEDGRRGISRNRGGSQSPWDCCRRTRR